MNTDNATHLDVPPPTVHEFVRKGALVLSSIGVLALTSAFFINQRPGKANAVWHFVFG